MGRANYFVVSISPPASYKHRLNFVDLTKSIQNCEVLGYPSVEEQMVWNMVMYPTGNGAERPCCEEVWVGVCICWKEKALLLTIWITLVLPCAGYTKQLSSV